MSKNLVRDWMTANPITINAKTSLHDAHKVMKDNRVRRLIVMEDGKLVGIVALSDVLTAEPSSATSLSVFELNYLLPKLTIDEIMTSEVISVPATATVRDAAKLMLDNKIGGLPVMDGDKLVGIITESDIFRLLVQTPELID